MTAQLDLFKDQRVPSYGPDFTKQRSLDDPEVRGMMATLNEARDRMMQSPEFKALQAQGAKEGADGAQQNDAVEPEAEPDQPCACVDCGAEGAEAEFVLHEIAGGPVCPDCITTREPCCHACGEPLATLSNGRAYGRRFYLPDGKLRCGGCNTAKLAEKEQPELTAAEATDEARVAILAYPFDDELHRNRCLFRIRARLLDRRNSEMKETRRAKIKIGEGWIASWARRTRARELAAIAADFYANAIEYDEAMRTGAEPIMAEDDDHYCERTIWAKRADELLEEANHGTSFGQSVNRRPRRMLALAKWWARRDGRLPMWGIGSVWRLEQDGTHYVADTRIHGLSISIDRDRHRPGHPCHSSTGFRSFGGPRDFNAVPDADHAETVAAYVQRSLDRYLNAPKTKHGENLAGRRERWIPFEAEPWARRERDRAKTLKDGHAPYDPQYRVGHPTMKDPEERAQYWREFDRGANADAEKALEWMEARGVDPYALFPDVRRQTSLL